MDELDKILDVVLVCIWIASVTYLLGLLIQGWFGKWKQHRERANKQYRLMLKQEDGDPFGIALQVKKEKEEKNE
jgi:hypothetical protein